MQPRISIIIPCYNGSEFLRETLDCLQKQTIEDWECIIVNDGSIDDSLEIMKDYAAKDSRYKYIDKQNEGPSVARNVGIKASTGKYILPLDADDLIEPDYTEIACNYLENHPKAKVVCSVAEYFGTMTGIWDIPEYSYEGELWNNAIFCPAIFRRSDFDQTCGYNPNMVHGNEDYDFWLSLLKEEDEVYKIPRTMLWYRKHGESRASVLSRNVKDNMGQLVLNHPERYKQHLWKLFVLESENKRLQKELDNLVNSTAYKIGRFFLMPYWWFCNLYNRNNSR